MENTEALDREVAAFLDTEKAQETLAKVEELAQQDPEIHGLVEKAETPDDMYEVFKKFVSMPIEAFKKLFHSVTEYFKKDKVALSDETMDSVVGGWSLSGFWNKYKERIIYSTAIIAIVGLGLTGVGAAVGGLIAAASLSATSAVCTGAIVGAVIGVGGTTAAAVADAYQSEFKK